MLSYHQMILNTQAKNVLSTQQIFICSKASSETSYENQEQTSHDSSNLVATEFPRSAKKLSTHFNFKSMSFTEKVRTQKISAEEFKT